MILQNAGERLNGALLDNGCGLGLYIEKLEPHADQVFGLEYDYSQAVEAATRSARITTAAGEALPFPGETFDLILSHEVIEHVQDDQQAIAEMVRTLKPRGHIQLFCPNRWYPVETHGIYWRGTYRFGNKLLVNYLPRRWRDRLAPHVNVYTRRDLDELFRDLPVKVRSKTVIFGAYDNIIYRFPGLGRVVRALLQALEKTPLRVFGISHYWVVEKDQTAS